jgi:hypothetical protein
MKKVMSVLIVLLTALSFAACEKANNPVTPNAVDKISQSTNGTFEVTFKDYRNSPRDVSMTGDIDFNFYKSTYSYNAVVRTDNEIDQSLHDSGTYRISGNSIEMQDNAAMMMGARWQSSLYLSGTYSYKETDSKIIIEGEGEYGTVKLVINR